MATPATTMQAVVQDKYGSAEMLQHRQVPKPHVDATQVLVRVHAAGLDRGTWHLMTGKPYLLRLGFGIRRPRNPVPGRSMAGVVEAVGAEVSRFVVGEQVYGIAPGCFAEYAVADERKIAPKPRNLSFEQAAAVPVSAATALVALTDVGQIEPDQKVLIIGASGGVGSYAVQLAKGFGAEVTGVASTGKLDLVRSLGATHVLDYTQVDFAATGERYDLILDLAGNPSLSRLRRALASDGTVVISGGEDGGDITGGMNRQIRALALSPFVRDRLTTFVNRERGSDLERLTLLIESGVVVPAIQATYSLAMVAEAMRRLDAGEVRGQLVIKLIPTPRASHQSVRATPTRRSRMP